MEARPTPATSAPVLPRVSPASIPHHDADYSRAERSRLKYEGQRDLGTGGKEIHLDGTPSPLAPNVGTTFDGLGQNGWIPYDAAICVGPSHIVVMTNSQWVVYDRNGTVVRAATQFTNWWSGYAGNAPFDPRCVYDAGGARFIMASVSKSSTQSLYHLSVSQTADPTGAWWNYNLNARLDGATNTSNWADFPGLGYDDNSIYLTSNQFTLSNNSFQYVKVRVLDKAVAMSGAPLSWADFVNMLNADGTKAFTLQPSRTLSASTTLYLLNNRSASGSNVTLWRITGGPSAPTLTRQATVTIGSYSIPPDAAQPGTSTLVATNDCRISDSVAWRNGILHAAFTEAFSGRSAVRYLRIDTNSNSLLKDITYTQTGVYYYFPAVTDDAAGNMYLVLSRSASTEYASAYFTGMTPQDTTIQSSTLAKAGVSTNTSGRWGDYSGIANDPADSLNVVGYVGWANTSNRWATRIFNMTFASGGTNPPTLSSISPTSGQQGTTVPVTLTGTDFLAGATVNVSGSGVTVSNVNVAGSTSITADFVIASSAATGTRNVSVTTSGGTSNSVSFDVTAAPAAPTISSMSPNKLNAGQVASLAIGGTNFVSGQTSVAVNDPKITVSNVVVSSSTALTATFAVASDAQGRGNYEVRVTTPGGTSNAAILGIYAVPTISSISPVNGNRGTSVNVDFTGTNFYHAAPAITGGGVTFNFVTVNCPACTSLTYRFNISSTAAPGPRDLTLSTPAGTSNIVIFTVNGPLSAPVLTSVSPAQGDTGTTVPVVLTGQFFDSSTTVGVSGGGVTVSNLVVVTSTKLTADLIIAGNASAGARNVTVTTSGGTSSAQSFTVNSTSSPLSITTTGPLPSWTQNHPGYSTTISATGGTTPYSWSVLSGSLPNGLTLATVGDNGVISGTPSASGTFNFTIQVTDGVLQTASQAFSIVVNPAVSISTSSLPGGTVGAAYSQTLAATGGTGALSWSITAGALPGGLLLAPSTGNISGTPTTAGTFNFTATATDAVSASGSQLLSIIVNPPPPTISGMSPTKINAGQTLNFTITGTNFVSGQTSVSVNDPKIAVSNVNVSSATQLTATFTAAPDAQGRGNYEVRVTTPSGTSNAAILGVYGVPTIAGLSPVSGTRGTAVNVIVTGTSLYGVTPSITGGGVSFSLVSSNCPTCTSATYRFTISSTTATGARTFTLTSPAGVSNGVTFTIN
jgi:hypothetical protein